jgi:hypothetical protein
MSSETVGEARHEAAEWKARPRMYGYLNAAHVDNRGRMMLYCEGCLDADI